MFQPAEQRRVEADAEREISLDETRKADEQQAGGQKRAKLDAETDDEPEQGGDGDRPRQAVDDRALVEQVCRGGGELTG